MCMLFKNFFPRTGSPRNLDATLAMERQNLPVGDPAEPFGGDSAQPKTTLARYVLAEERCGLTLWTLTYEHNFKAGRPTGDCRGHDGLPFQETARLDIRSRPGNRYHSARAIGNGRGRKYANVHDSKRAVREKPHGGDPHARHRIQAMLKVMPVGAAVQMEGPVGDLTL